jgi:hypothetical protein
MVKIDTRIRGAGLRVESLCRLTPALSPSYSRKLTGKFLGPFRHKIERGVCASVRGAACFKDARGFTHNRSGIRTAVLREHAGITARPKDRGISSILAASQTGCPGETNALETEFSRQRASSRSRGGEFACYTGIRGWLRPLLCVSASTRKPANILAAGEFAPKPLRPGPHMNELKALGISTATVGGNGTDFLRFQEGSGVSR